MQRCPYATVASPIVSKTFYKMAIGRGKRPFSPFAPLDFSVILTGWHLGGGDNGDSFPHVFVELVFRTRSSASSKLSTYFKIRPLHNVVFCLTVLVRVGRGNMGTE